MGQLLRALRSKGTPLHGDDIYFSAPRGLSALRSPLQGDSPLPSGLSALRALRSKGTLRSTVMTFISFK